MSKLCSSSVGCVKGVDEENAYSWPACDICGNGKLSSVEGGTGRCVCVCVSVCVCACVCACVCVGCMQFAWYLIHRHTIPHEGGYVTPYSNKAGWIHPLAAR